MLHARGKDKCVEVTGAKVSAGVREPSETAFGPLAGKFRGPGLGPAVGSGDLDTRGDAEGWLGRRRGEVLAGEWQPPVKVPKVASLTFDAYSAQWLRERDLKPRIREGYEHLLRRYLTPVLGPLTIDSITPSVCVPGGRSCRRTSDTDPIWNDAAALQLHEGSPGAIGGWATPL